MAAAMNKRTAAVAKARPEGNASLPKLQRATFRYFWRETNPENGLIADNTSGEGFPASIAGVGFALSSYPVAVERSFVSRAKAVERTLATLRFFWHAPHGPEPDATGHRGFFYHFLDVATGRRAWRCELSTIDTAILIAGALTAAAYFDRPTESEREIAIARRFALSAGRLALGARRRTHRLARLEAGERLSEVPMGGIQRSVDSLRARPRLADARLAGAEL